MKKIIFSLLLINSTYLFADEGALEKLTKKLQSESYSQNADSEDYTDLKKLNVELDADTLTKWYVDCSKDRFNSTKKCSLSKYSSDLRIMNINGRYSVYVGRNHYPRSQSALKVDNNSTMYGYEGIIRSPEKAIEQLKNGKVAYTRYSEWPYESKLDGEVDLNGFSEKFEEMLILYKQL